MQLKQWMKQMKVHLKLYRPFRMQLKYYLACGKLKQGPLGMATFLFSVSIWKRFVSRVSIVVLSVLKVVQSISYFFRSHRSGHKGMHKPKSKYSFNAEISFWIAKTTDRLPVPSTEASHKNEDFSFKWELHTFLKPFPNNEDIWREWMLTLIWIITSYFYVYYWYFSYTASYSTNDMSQ